MLRKFTIFVITVLICLFALPGCFPQAHRKSASASELNIAYHWIDVAIEATAHDVKRYGARPTVGSRSLAIPATSIFDAWAAYDDKAVGTRLGGTLRRPQSERSDANKRKAISYAAYRTLLDVYPDDATYFTKQMLKLGFDPNDLSTNKATPQGIGNTVAAALIKYRHHDGANQLGDEIGSSGKPYSDYTFYQAVNTTDKINDPDHWQPITFSDGKGGTKTLGFLTPHWYRVKPFALLRADQFRPPPPPLVGSDQLLTEVQEVMKFNANLTPEQKALVEFMRDGPSSTGQSGHWMRFAQDVSRRDKHDLDQDVKMFFAVSNVTMDAFIAAWDAKRKYDTSRPWTLIHHYFKGQQIEGWGGVGKGSMKMLGEQWHPYSPDTFITPPFPGYVSGHSTVSAASAEMLRLFKESDTFNESATVKAGALTEPGFESLVTLKFPTFTFAADAAGISRLYGGYHTHSDNIEGLKLGREVAQFVWQKVLKHINGTSG
ncbi:MAG: vanadium-dependent haloperoxidase [Rhizonema sp. PD37]|nr:vanadium-dependent haloperoxidase [Rhizonema sp. PD37]